MNSSVAAVPDNNDGPGKLHMIYRKAGWLGEVLIIAVFYGAYSLVRNVHGSVLSRTEAFEHAQQVVSAERTVHIFSEERIQDFFLRWPHFIKALNIYYGTAHFIVVIVVLLWLYFRQKNRYQHWRNILGATTALALVGYMIYPLAPPRFLPAHYDIIDTIKIFGGSWSFDSSATEKISNQYAAMPSLHVAWALWVAMSLEPALKHWATKALVALYPALTTLTILVTGNHYWFDVFGGVLVFGLGYTLASFVEKWRERRRHGPTEMAPMKTEAKTANKEPAQTI